MANNFDIKGLDIKDHLDYIKTSHIENAENLFKLSKTDILEINKLVYSLLVRKAKGYDNISNSMLKKTHVLLLPHTL